MKKGITFGAFDLFHAGHVLMFEEAKTVCDHLIVGIQTDPSIDRKSKNPPVQSIVERQIQVSGCKYVDEVIPYNFEKDLHDILLGYPIDVRIIGADYRDVDFSGKDICLTKGIEIYYNERSHNFSSTELRQRIQQAENDKQIKTN